MLAAVKDTLGAYPEQTLADAGYRSEAVFAALTGCTDLVVAIGREGKEHREIDEASLPLTAAMVTKRKTREARELIADANGWPSHRTAGSRTSWDCVSSACGACRVQAEWKLVCTVLNLRRMATMQAA